MKTSAFVAVIAALLLATGTANAWQRALSFQEQFLPPKEFDHEYTGALTIFKDLKSEDLPAGCQKAVAEMKRPDLLPEALACSTANHFGPDTCAIWIVGKDIIEYEGWDYDIIMRHEIGHCNGWRHEH